MITLGLTIFLLSYGSDKLQRVDSDHEHVTFSGPHRQTS